MVDCSLLCKWLLSDLMPASSSCGSFFKKSLSFDIYFWISTISMGETQIGNYSSEFNFSRGAVIHTSDLFYGIFWTHAGYKIENILFFRIQDSAACLKYILLEKGRKPNLQHD